MASVRFRPPTANIQPTYGDTTARATDPNADYSQKVLRAQSVAGKTDGKNFSGEFSDFLKNTATIMKASGAGANITSMFGKQLALDKFTKKQKQAYEKYNAAAQKLGMQTKNMNDLKMKMSDLQGQISALQSAGCDFTNALNDAKNNLNLINDQIDQKKQELTLSEQEYARAEQAFKDAMGRMFSAKTKPDRDKARADAKKANEDMANADNNSGQIKDDLDGLAGKYEDKAKEYNSTLDKSNENLNQLGGKLGEMDNLNSQGGQAEADRQKSLQEMGSASNDVGNNGRELLGELKTWDAVGGAGAQSSGWADAVGQFGNEEFYRAGGSAINQTLNTFRQYGGVGGGATDMITPFLQQAITQGSNTLEAGGSAADFAVTFMNATLGLSDWVQGANAVGNAIEYMRAGDNFMAAIEANNSISPFLSGAGKAYQSMSVFTGTPSPAVGMVADFVGDFMQTTGGEVISSFEIAKAGGDFFGSLVSGATAPFYAVAHGFGELVDKATQGMDPSMRTDWASKMEQDRLSLKRDLSGLKNLQRFTENVFIDPDVTFNPDAFTPVADPNCPNVAERLKDPMNTSSRGGGRGCPIKKPEPSSSAIANSYD